MQFFYIQQRAFKSLPWVPQLFIKALVPRVPKVERRNRDRGGIGGQKNFQGIARLVLGKRPIHCREVPLFVLKLQDLTTHEKDFFDERPSWETS